MEDIASIADGEQFVKRSAPKVKGRRTHRFRFSNHTWDMLDSGFSKYIDVPYSISYSVGDEVVITRNDDEEKKLYFYITQLVDGENLGLKEGFIQLQVEAA
jgi:hypothetical protein